MKTYYIHNGQNQEGPYNIDELKQKGLTIESYVWTEGMPEWDKIGNLEDLKGHFASTPPPFKATTTNELPKVEAAQSLSTSKPNNRKSSLTISLVILVLAIIGGIIYFSKNHSSESERSESLFQESPNTKSPEELKHELLLKEQESPEIYLKNEGSWHENLIGQTVLKGTIISSATVASFKDIVLNVTWLSKTETELKTEQYTVFEYIGPGKSVDYKIKVFAPEATGGVRVEINSATPVE